VLEYVDGVFHRPPFPPSAEHWLGTDELGRDILSFLLYGTRNTLVAAAFITMARLGLGLALGGVAGWNEGKLADQLVMGTIQVLASLPLLLIGAILILAFDVRRGLPVFVVALCSIGWGEIAQYVRAEFSRIKREPYLDSGRVIGLNALELAVRHVLPNVLPALIVITLLEMGAVLMILGELGFVGIYIGGGITIQIDDFTQRQYFAVPEWGAMMAQSRAWARSRPWMVIFPAISFFVSVTGFNLLGEGLRRLIERGVFNTALLLSWRVLLAVALISSASIYVMLTLGPAPSYRQLAEQVSQAGMMSHIEYLTSDFLNGRAVGSEEAQQVAEYIQDELLSYGLETFVRDMETTLYQPSETPELALLSPTGETLAEFTRLVDFGESIERHGGSGDVQAPITLLLFPPDEGSRRRTAEEAYARFGGLDLRGRIVMVLAGNAPYTIDTDAMIHGAEGVVVVSVDRNPRNQILVASDADPPHMPVFRISYEAADTILAVDGLQLETVREEIEALDWEDQELVAWDLEAQLSMKVDFGPGEIVTIYNVMGLLNGSDAQLANEAVIISAHYDGLGRGPDGTLYSGANENASGVAVMLEIARLWQQQEFQPRRTVIFSAWGGGLLRYSGAHGFVDRPGALGAYDVSTVVHLDRMGSAEGTGLSVRQLGQRSNIFDLFISSASSLEVEIFGGAAVRYPYQQVFHDRYEPRYGGLIVTWGDPPPALAGDTMDNIDPENLNQAALAINLTLINAAHEPQY
jgi:ABC-type dipeptide/oligopeptide/nickel transport system permease subunit